MDLHRMNIEANDNGISICYGHHDKSSPCEYEPLSPQETVDLINQLCTELQKTNTLKNEIFNELITERKKNEKCHCGGILQGSPGGSYCPKCESMFDDVVKQLAAEKEKCEKFQFLYRACLEDSNIWYNKLITERKRKEDAEEKVKYTEKMGLRFGIMKTSDKPEGFLQHIWDKDSDHERMFREWSESIGWEKEKLDLESQIESLTEVLKSLLTYAEINTCLHEETYRGGTIWEICSMCGKKWADDEGGKPEDAHEPPKAIANAQNILTNLPKKSENVRKVLEVANDFEKDGEPCCDAGRNLCSAVQKWRKE